MNPFQLQVDYDEFGFPSGTELPPDRDWAQGQNTNADRPKAFDRKDGNGFENYFKVCLLVRPALPSQLPSP